MEVKTLDSMPIWFCKILSSLEIFPTSFSKYGKVYTDNIIGKENRNNDKNKNVNVNEFKIINNKLDKKERFLRVV